MYAIIRTGGKQYRVSEGDEIFVEKLEGDAGDAVELEVLAVSTDDGLSVGDAIKSAAVNAEIVKHGKGKKIRVFKYKAKKRYRRTQGHRQPYTSLKITSIEA